MEHLPLLGRLLALQANITTRLERLDRYKRYSLICPILSYKEKSFVKTAFEVEVTNSARP
jgi:hypothetical protein